MGTWDTGPFGNDTAADWARDLDAAAWHERADLVRAVLVRTVGIRDYLEAPEGELAVAAAGLVAAQCPGGEPVSPVFGPDEPLPVLPADLRRPAAEALDRVLADDSELPALWGDVPDGTEWRASLARLRGVLIAGAAGQGGGDDAGRDRG